MDLQQLTIVPGRTVWSLSDEAVREGTDSWVDTIPWWLHELPTEAEAAPGPGAPAAMAGAARSSGSRLVLGIAAAVALVLSAAAGVAFLAGVRWFVVETPSMGTAAPVGTLVVTAPTAGALHRGEVIAFTPPGVPRTYTHRVLAVAADGGIRTKGDINGAADPWTIERSSVIGRAIALLPGIGFAIRGLPVLLAGALVVVLVTMPIRGRSRRASLRIIGVHLVATGVLLWLHPLVQLVLIASEAAGDAVRASVVSTGLLPIRLVDTAGTVLAHLGAGTPQVVTLSSAAQGAGHVSAVPDLAWPLQVVLIAVAVLPSLVVLAVGLPRDEPEAR